MSRPQDCFAVVSGYDTPNENDPFKNQNPLYLSLFGDENAFDYSERLVLNHVTPIFALEFTRERERSEVESRYHVEAFMNVLQGQYQQPEEILARVRHLGYDLTGPQIVVLFAAASSEADAALLQ